MMKRVSSPLLFGDGDLACAKDAQVWLAVCGSTLAFGRDLDGLSTWPVGDLETTHIYEFQVCDGFEYDRCKLAFVGVQSFPHLSQS